MLTETKYNKLTEKSDLESTPADEQLEHLMELFDRVMQLDNAGISDQWAHSGRSATCRRFEGFLESAGAK